MIVAQNVSGTRWILYEGSERSRHGESIARVLEPDRAPGLCRAQSCSRTWNKRPHQADLFYIDRKTIDHPRQQVLPTNIVLTEFFTYEDLDGQVPGRLAIRKFLANSNCLDVEIRSWRLAGFERLRKRQFARSQIHLGRLLLSQTQLEDPPWSQVGKWHEFPSSHSSMA